MKSIHESSEWLALERHWSDLEPRHMREMFAAEPQRYERMSLQACGMLLDYSKNRASSETMALLLALAERAELKKWIGGMFGGERINNTEGRAVLHVALRNRSSQPILLDGVDVMPAVRTVLARMEKFSSAVRDGGWQTSVGRELAGRTLGVLGLGRIGVRVARIGEAFGMKVIAWSQNLTPEAAAEAGATRVSREDLFATADVLSVHLKLSGRSAGLVGAAELALMKPMALLVNTSRGPIVDEAALVAALRSRTIAGAALDVFDTDPLPSGHPLRTLDNVLATPHIGYVADRPYRIFFRDAVAAISDWLDANAQ